MVVLRNKPNQRGVKILQTTQGSLQVNDYTQHPVETTNDAIVIEENNDYKIVSYKLDSSFLINLLSKPVKNARARAERAFVSNLNITQQQACTLNVSVKTPFSVDPAYAGLELGMSFCNNSVVLP